MANTPFDALLDWLDPDRDQAALKYETIRGGLIRLFISKRFNGAEDLADDVIKRVTKRLPEIRDTYVGEPARYFHGVARNLLREVPRRREIATDAEPIASIQITNQSDEYDCLLRCLKFIPRVQREMLLDYHIYEGHEKIEQHKIMAEELDISEGALRCRVHRLRTGVEKCVLECKESLRKKQK